MDICCVVVTYNRKELLIECIEAILNQTYKLKKIIIIDNNSTDGTEKILGEKDVLSIPYIQYLKLDKNIGGAGGFSKGVREALKDSYDWVWLMDDDTIPLPNALEELIYSLQTVKEKNLSFLCSKVIGVSDEEMNIPNISKRVSENGYNIWMKYLNKGIVEVESATFVSVLINYDGIRKVGLPWEKFFIWGDDIEYTLRLSKNYGPGYVVGKSIVVHKRIGAKNLSIIEENDINRLNMYKYKFRNEMLLLEYMNFSGKVKSIIAIFLFMFKVLIKSEEKKLKKFYIVLSATLNGLFNRSLKKAFKNRMSLEEI